MPLPLEHKPQPGPAGGTGFLDELRSVYAAIDDDDVQTEVFDVEGSHAAVRYRRMRLEDRLRSQGGDGHAWENNAQFLIEACVEILHRDPDTGALSPAAPGLKVTFDWREDSTPLHEALGVQETDIRRSVLRLFQGVDEALLRHAQDVDQWMGRADLRAAERFAGG